MIARRISLRLTAFDIAAAILIVALLAAIVGVIVAGDHVGVGVTDFSPEGRAHTKAAIRITFDEPMDSASVASHFTIDPPIAGNISWIGSQFTFTPSVPFTGGQRYTVNIAAGTTTPRERQLTNPLRWSFDVSAPHVAYLSPALADKPANLWLVDPNAPFTGIALTNNGSGILSDYAVSPDGTRIAYAAPNADGTADLYVVAVDTGVSQRVTQCVRAICQLPDWSPDGTRLVYERTENSAPDMPRPWVVALANLSATPVFASAQISGHEPRWSPNGNEIAVYDVQAHEIVVYDIVNGGRKQIQTAEGNTGIFDPMGSRMVYPVLLQNQQGFYTGLSIAHLTDPSKGVQALQKPDQPAANDRTAAWSPDGKTLLVARQLMDGSSMSGAQLYLIDSETGDSQTLLNDPQFNHAAVSFDPTGQSIVMQRLDQFAANPEPGIWVYDLNAKTVRHIARNGFLPQWVP